MYAYLCKQFSVPGNGIAAPTSCHWVLTTVSVSPTLSLTASSMITSDNHTSLRSMIINDNVAVIFFSLALELSSA